MPEKHKDYSKWNAARFKEWAVSIGEKTAVVIAAIFASNRIEQQGYKSCMSVLKLADQYGKGRLEAACARALQYTPRPGHKQILNILSSGQDQIEAAMPVIRASEFSFVRGADYYKGGKK